MKKVLISGLAVIFILAIALTSIINLKAKEDNNLRKIYLKETFNMTVEDNNDKDKISKNEALKIAEKFSHNLSSEAKEVKVSHYRMTTSLIAPDGISKKAKELNPKLEKEHGIDKLPVWMITYDGLQLPAKGNGNKYMTEQNWVIDAETGEVLFVFS